MKGDTTEFDIIVRRSDGGALFARMWTVIGGSLEARDLEALRAFAKALDKEIRYRERRLEKTAA